MPDWPVVAACALAGVPVTAPSAVMSAQRVAVCSAQARAQGVRRGMRRRDAQSRCPELVLLPDNPGRDSRLFEPIAVAVEQVAPGIEVLRPGMIAVPAAGPAAFYGGETAAAEQLVDQVATVGVECQVGIADTLPAALLAARYSRILDTETTPAFLATLPLTDLHHTGRDHGTLIDLLHRLGLSTFGEFAALPERDVTSRFGRDALAAHRLVRGLTTRPPARRRPPPELAVSQDCDPLVDRVDHVAFVAQSLGDRLHTALAARGLACTQLRITATTATGQEYSRVWRTADPLTARGIGDRVRWQCQGWLTQPPDDRPGGGITSVRLDPDETVGGASLQTALPAYRDADTDAAERAHRALVRVQALLGHEGVVTGLLDGGRGPADRVRLIPWGDPRTPITDPDAPWPGRLPAPSPTIVPTDPPTATVLGASGHPIHLTDLSELTEPPHSVAIGTHTLQTVVRWGGPWPFHTPGWPHSPTTGPAARIQVILTNSERGDTAYLLTGGSLHHPQWRVEGQYD